MVSGAITVFEGITLNRASELLYGTEETGPQRAADSRQYVKCLENVVFGVVFGGCVATGKVQDLQTTVSPFKQLKSDLKLNVEEVDPQGLSEPQLLEDPDEVAVLRDLILGLDDALQRDDSDAWRSLARREVTGSLSDPALKIELDDPSKYQFAGRPNFWPHRELQERVPEHYLREMLTTVRNRVALPAGICEKALRAFLSRNVLAHLLIFRTYQLGVRRRYSSAAVLHLPYPTRASLVPDWSNSLWMLRQYLMPRIILKLLDESSSRGDFRKSLGYNAWSNAYVEYRSLFAEALTLQAEDRATEADEVINALKELSQGHPIDTLRIGNIGARHSGRPLPIAVRKELVAADYRAALLRVFPELRFDSSAERQTAMSLPLWHTGYKRVNEKLKLIRDQIHCEMQEVQALDLESFLLFLGAVGAIASLALQGNVFRGGRSEAEFQKEMRDLLRQQPQLGAEVQEHTHVAGGITDLSFRGIPLELKVVSDEFVSRDDAPQYLSQLKMYSVGNDQRFGVLCILDCSAKQKPPDSAANEIAFEVVKPREGTFALGMGIVIIRGNLSRPSAYSR